jgi:glycosyltransferase involved in cell wall biosynthesis/ATP adenylyltransferase/5',5'''-P-1,P-4-tetraphosphate phosphorylase II
MKKKTINCFIQYVGPEITARNVATLKAEEAVNEVFVFFTRPEDERVIHYMEGCSALRFAPEEGAHFRRQLLLYLDTPFCMFYMHASALKLNYRALERMTDFLEDERTGMVYADHTDLIDGKPMPHPVIDYQLGSVRNDFDFGPLTVWSSKLLLGAMFQGIMNSKYTLFYEARLYLSLTHCITAVHESLYSVEQMDRRKSGEKQFDYVNPNAREAQEAYEQAYMEFTAGGFNAYIDREIFHHPRFDEETFPCEASVIIPVRNRVRTIADAINSALAQHTSFKYNIIVVDNHSTDGTTEVLRQYADNPQVVHLTPERTDLGIGGCWDLAIRHEACGQFAIQLDSDDLYSSPATLQLIIDKFRQEGCGMVVGSYQLTDFNLRPLPPGVIDHREWTAENGHNNLLRVNGIGAPRAFFTPALREMGVPNVSYGEDYALALAFSRQYPVGRIFDVLYLCRRWEGNSDAALNIEQVNRNNRYKDALRTREILIRRKLRQYYETDWQRSELIGKQLEEWPLAQTNYQHLHSQQWRRIPTPSQTWEVCFNPQRARSTRADVSAKGIEARPCFLCEKNRPKEQRTMEQKENHHHYEVCVNPYPILSEHLTLIHQDHTPQRFDPSVYEAMKYYARTLADYLVFYNGPQCGASAPDHLHLQGVKKEDVPLTRHMEEMVRECQEIAMLYGNSEADNFARLYLNLKAYPCPLFIMRSSTGYAASVLADATAQALGGKEGMMNVLAWRKDDVLYTVFVPRSAHRPACYFAPEAEAIHISPGALDMAGVMVATDEASFNRLSIQTVERILSEVGVTREQAIAQAHSIAHLLDEGHKGDTSLRNRDLTIVTFPIAPLASL